MIAGLIVFSIFCFILALGGAELQLRECRKKGFICGFSVKQHRIYTYVITGIIWFLGLIIIYNFG